MAILGLTDRPASFPQIGILRKGAPKPERGPGRDLKHFRFDCDDADAADRFRTVYGDEPTSVRVYLPFPTAAENFEAWQEHWTAGALQHRCDGQTCVLWLDPKTQRYSSQPVPCPHAKLSRDERDRCKPSGRLKVIVPELRRLAYVTVLTGSVHDIIALTEQLQALEALRGDLRGIPMILRRTPREVSMPGKEGKRTRVEKWLLSIEAAPTWVDLQLAAQEQAARPSLGAPALALPAPAADPATGQVLDGDWGDPDDEPAAQAAAPALAVANDPETTKRLTSDLKALRAQARELLAPCPAVPNGRDATAADLQACLLATRQAMLSTFRALLDEADQLGIPVELPAAVEDLMPAQLVFFGKQIAEQIATAAPAEQLL